MLNTIERNHVRKLHFVGDSAYGTDRHDLRRLDPLGLQDNGKQKVWTMINDKAATYQDPDFALNVMQRAMSYAKDKGVGLSLEDFGTDEFGDPGIDGMDPIDWVNAVAG